MERKTALAKLKTCQERVKELEALINAKPKKKTTKKKND